ncbi:Protocatechuate 3,4-dioxygenase beta chain [Meiothermus luteus]|jgi:protocatechuate 3,4-dioxygenase beta subunit|uniref:Protocatechuate 3,4-dioxygenase beta chain n=1 Tax=Meiothermus luteus TaxID=2026184 RepID=A0A399EF61_9DEIN|nr:intradiol ring-cleavage dioxygenase [Meiothermus luteus]RIH81789.1 Protocatechuate 3,4-dioxygenase beta chain [Meiothermus luteus]RMH54069.1 MAG: twin-arginine translocation pathway signal protein [Deinococcota bacterium]
MDNDDKPIGRILSRREVLAVLGGMSGLLGGPRSAAQGGSSAFPACVVRPALTEGPYFVDVQLNRSDIRSDPTTGVVKPGVPLRLRFVVTRVSAAGCLPLPGAMVDIWQCDAQGMYSGVRDRYGDTRGQKWLRGYQVTDAQGVAQFTTIYPGWYPGRTVHIHFKIRYQNRDFTSQLFFDDALSDRILANPPYAKPGNRIRNIQDSIYRSGGSQLLLNLVPEGSGYAATFEIGLSL